MSDDGRLIVASGGVGGFWRIWFPARYPWVHTSSTFRPSVRSGGAPVRSLKKLGLCEALANLGAPRVYFRETRILQGSRARLCDYAGLLRRFPAVCVRIEGHCSVGMAPLLAPRLSYSRAEAVRDALLQSQVEATQLELGACGNNVALRAGWSATEAAVVELFFSFDGLQLPPRPAHYRDHTESDLGVSEVTGRAGAPEMH